MVQKARTFLENNKIFFEIFSNVILGIMGIIISISAIRLTKYQNILTERELLPVMEIREYLEENEENLYLEENIQISNVGGALYGFQTDMACVLNINYITEGLEKGTIKKELDGYYYYSRNTQAATGILEIIGGYNNNYNFSNLQLEIMEGKYKEYGISFLEIKIESYLKIEYYDVLDNKHTEYYKLADSTEKIEEQEGNDIFQEYRNSLDIFKLGADHLEKILEYVKEDIKN